MKMVKIFAIVLACLNARSNSFAQYNPETNKSDVPKKMVLNQKGTVNNNTRVCKMNEFNIIFRSQIELQKASNDFRCDFAADPALLLNDFRNVIVRLLKTGLQNRLQDPGCKLYTEQEAQFTGIMGVNERFEDIISF